MTDSLIKEYIKNVYSLQIIMRLVWYITRYTMNNEQWVPKWNKDNNAAFDFENTDVK